jgi:hypothetical protein
MQSELPPRVKGGNATARQRLRQSMTPDKEKLESDIKDLESTLESLKAKRKDAEAKLKYSIPINLDVLTRKELG